MEAVIGLDIGTSAVKAVLVNRKGKILAAAQRNQIVRQPVPGWMEQDPEIWWQNSKEALRELTQSASFEKTPILGIAVTGQMNGPVFLDRNHDVLGPCLIWADSRTARECAEIHGRVGRKRLIRITGKDAVTGYTAPKVLWFRKHAPERFQKIRHILLPKDYVRHKLTGEIDTDLSDASNTLLFDIHKACWSEELLAALEIDSEILPPAIPSLTVSGVVTREAAQSTGVSKDIPVFAGAGDSIAETLGSATACEGPVLSVLGTSGNISALSRKPVIDEQGRIHTGYHLDSNSWILTGVQQAAGLSIQWLFENLRLYESLAGGEKWHRLSEEAAAVAPGIEGLIFLPYLNGERTPHLNPHARGVFFGIAAHHTRAQLGRAVLEGIAFSQRDSVELLQELSLPTHHLVVSAEGAGTGSGGKFWRMLCNSRSESKENGRGAAYGAALIAAMGSGLDGGVEGGVDAWKSWAEPVQPQSPSLGSSYDLVFASYREIYRRLAPMFTPASSVATDTKKGCNDC